MKFFLLALALATPVFAQTSKEETAYANRLQTSLHAADRESLATAEENLLASLTKWEKSPTSAPAVAEIRKLLALPRQEISSPAELEGDWRVRSLQVSAYGASAYPFFPSRIFPEDDALTFQKSKGSQRRQGLLGRTNDKEFLFLGASYYEGDPLPVYSAWLEKPTAADRKRDSAGQLFKVGKDHLIILFAPQERRAEVMELVRDKTRSE